MSGQSRNRLSRALVVLVSSVLAVTALASGTPRAVPAAAAATPTVHAAGGFTYVKTLAPAPAQCVYNGGFLSVYYIHGDCIRIEFSISETDTGSHTVQVQLRNADGSAVLQTITPTHTANSNDWMAITPIDEAGTWTPGKIDVHIVVDGKPAGDGEFFFNALGATVTAAAPAGGRYVPGQNIPLTGSIAELNDLAANTQKTGVGATFKVRLVGPTGNQLWISDVQTAGSDGTFPAITIPGASTSGVTATAATGYRTMLGIEVVDASFVDGTPLVGGNFAGNPAGSSSVTIQVPPQTLIIDNLYASPTGWVKPGDTFPFILHVYNYTANAASNVTVAIPVPDGVTFTSANAQANSGSASVGGNGAITWTIRSLAAATGSTPTVATLVAEGQADSLGQDPEIVWKDLSNTATLTYNGLVNPLTASTHGPKVIPPAGDFETARYGDKPFVMVPVDFRDRKHTDNHTGEALSNAVNSPNDAGSPHNLYLEMSYGQLNMYGDVPSAEVASADFSPGPFDFSKRDVTKPTCRGTTNGDLGANQTLVEGTPAYPERIHDGWYQLPGDTEYYGGDFPAFTLGTGSTIDGACGPTSKSVYDAAVIADPEVNYNDYDLDKDGVVDFFMMVFAGKGGNGDSQINGTPPYDNIWPHSSNLEESYTDPTTGLKGYITHDQLTNQEGVPQCWVGNSYVNHTDCDGTNTNPVYVRVGPYNVNPESAIDKSSVIAHEYGHHLGVPDFYSTSYTTYNDWNLMASDYSQHMTVYIKQEYGWVVPTFLQPGDSVNVHNWNEIKNDTHTITWQRPDGTPYTLSGPNVHNGQTYGLKLPRGSLIDAAKVPSAPNLWYSGRGNEFGCTPVGGHNLDVALPELANVPSGTTVTLKYKSSWDMEWDFDYGFTMVTTDGKTYTSLPSANAYTNPSAINPNSNACQAQYGNGLTGNSQSYQDGTFAADRNPAAPVYGSAPFLQDQYDLSSYAGQSGVVLRFSYATDPALDRPGWFIDDLEVSAGGQVIYSSNFTNNDPQRIVSGGCDQENGARTADQCTAGWSLIDAAAGVEKDHAYYLELRDRSGFDANSHNEADRGSIGWAPGVLVEFTDESRGYGNNGASPPRQHYIDSQPEPGLDCGEALADDPTTARDDGAKRCDDAACTAAAGDNHFKDVGWVDNFSDPASDDGLFHFDYNCLELTVNSMSGEDINDALPSNLTADATITALPGCAQFSYTGSYPNAAPIARASVKPASGVVNQNFHFDGSGSTDDTTPSNQLSYTWDFGDGSPTAVGQTAMHQFSTAGVKTVTLTVSDGSKSSTDTVSVTVSAPSATPTPTPTPTATATSPTPTPTNNGQPTPTPTGQPTPTPTNNGHPTPTPTGHPTPAPTGKADLVVTASTVTQNSASTTTVNHSDVVTFTATVLNRGGQPAGANKIQWYVLKQKGTKARVLGKALVPALGPGQSIQIQITYDASKLKPGTYKVRVWADFKKKVKESNNKNNKFYFYLTVLNS
jgi:M6 family metalloprotease-like protein